MKWEITHRTHYTYATAVRDSFNEARLQPFSDEWQTVEHFLLKVLPAARLQHHHDFYSNIVHRFEIPEPHTTLLVESSLRVTTRLRPALAAAAAPFPLARIGEAASELRVFEFLQESRFVEMSPEVWRFALDATEGVTDTWQAALALMKAVHGALKYEPNSTGVHTHARDVLRDKRGVCQDFAHVMIALVRSLGIPCRYVSGYLFHNHKGSERSIDGASHAWVEAWLPSLGWVGFDPTNKTLATDRHIRVAIGRDYWDVPPNRGAFKGNARSELGVAVRVQTTDAPIEPSDVMPALYVSGYLATETASATHAWVEVLIPGLGWRPLDPTHNCQPDETYVKIAVGRDYADVPPMTGNYRGTRERKLDVQVSVRRVE